MAGGGVDGPRPAGKDDAIDASATRTGRVGALIRSSHPGPSLAITAMVVVLAVGAGSLHGWVALPFTLAVLIGQLSIGWSNDAFDAELDRAAGRTDKPVVTGAISVRTLAVIASPALVISLVLGFALNPVTGVANLFMVGAAWAYNAGLKSTVASGLMYLLGFGPIPWMATSTLPGHPAPRAWTVAAAGLLGLGGHFANVLPDLDTDRAGGVQGLPQRISSGYGSRAVRFAALVLLLTASVLIALAPGATRRWIMLVGLGGAVVLAAVGARASGRTPFACAVGIAALNVVMFVFGGAALV